MNLVLIGYRCSGKTEVGKNLARELSTDFLDTDAVIEQRAGCTIEHIIAGNGWEAFRAMERELIKELSEKDHLIIATGGGAVMDEVNVSRLKRNGWLIWLKGSEEALKKRMTADHQSVSMRPSLTGMDTLEEIRHVLAQRIPYYRKAGNCEIDTTHLSVKEVVRSILNMIPSGLWGQ